MKNFAILIIGFAAILLTASCTNSTDNTQFNIQDPTQVRAGSLVESKNTMDVQFNGQTISINTADILVVSGQMSAEDQDAIDVMNVNQALLGAEKEAQLLDVKFSMSDEPVENGVFVFGIESADAKNLTLEMFDEEGFEMAANNKFDITEGNNYKALNVKSMDAGNYLFRLKDDSGKELVRTVSITHKD